MGALTTWRVDAFISPKVFPWPYLDMLKDAGLCGSTSDAMRMIQQGAAKIDGEKIADKSVRIMKGTEGVFQVGKRKFAKVTMN